MSGAGQRDTGHISGPEIVPGEETVGARAVVGRFLGREFRRPAAQVFWVREREIIQPADVRNRHAGGNRWFGVRRIKIPRLGRMRGDLQLNLECPFDIGRGGVHVQHHPVRVRAGDGKAVGGGEGQRGLIILLGGAKLVLELPGCQVMPVIWAGGVVKLFEQVGQLVLVAKREADSQVQAVRARQAAGWLEDGRLRRYMARQYDSVRRRTSRPPGQNHQPCPKYCDDSAGTTGELHFCWN